MLRDLVERAVATLPGVRVKNRGVMVSAPLAAILHRRRGPGRRSGRGAAGNAAAAPLPALLARVDDLHRRRDDKAAWNEQQRLVQTLIARAPSDYGVLWRAARFYFWASDDPGVAKEQRSRWGKDGWDLAETRHRRQPERRRRLLLGGPLHGQLRPRPGRREGAVAGHGGEVPRPADARAGVEPGLRAGRRRDRLGPVLRQAAVAEARPEEGRGAPAQGASSSTRTRCGRASTWPARTSTAIGPSRRSTCSTRSPRPCRAATTRPRNAGRRRWRRGSCRRCWRASNSAGHQAEARDCARGRCRRRGPAGSRAPRARPWARTQAINSPMTIAFGASGKIGRPAPGWTRFRRRWLRAARAISAAPSPRRRAGTGPAPSAGSVPVQVVPR